jgi:hypothetical protein
VERTLRNLFAFKFIKHIYPEQEKMRLLDWDIWKVLQTTCAERLKDWELSGNRVNVVTKLFTADMLIKRENDIDDPVFVLAGQHSNLKRSYIVVHLKEYLTTVKHSAHVNEFEQQSCSAGGDGDNDNERSNSRPKPFLNTQALSIVLNMQMTLANFHDKILVCCGFLDANYCAKLVEKNSKSIMALINKKQNVEMSEMSEIVETQIRLKYTIVSKTAYGGDEILHQFFSTLKQCYLFDDVVRKAMRSLVPSRSNNLQHRAQKIRHILSNDDDDERQSMSFTSADMTTSVAATTSDNAICDERPSNPASTDNTIESLFDNSNPAVTASLTASQIHILSNDDDDERQSLSFTSADTTTSVAATTSDNAICDERPSNPASTDNTIESLIDNSNPAVTASLTASQIHILSNDVDDKRQSFVSSISADTTAVVASKPVSVAASLAAGRRWFIETLSDEQMSEVDLALNRSNTDDDVNVCNKFGFQITSGMIKRLRLKTKENENDPLFRNNVLYLNDELINFNSKILQECDDELCKITPRRRSHLFPANLVNRMKEVGFRGVRG